MYISDTPWWVIVSFLVVSLALIGFNIGNHVVQTKIDRQQELLQIIQDTSEGSNVVLLVGSDSKYIKLNLYLRNGFKIEKQEVDLPGYLDHVVRYTLVKTKGNE